MAFVSSGVNLSARPKYHQLPRDTSPLVVVNLRWIPLILGWRILCRVADGDDVERHEAVGYGQNLADRGKSAAGVVTTKYTKYTKNWPVAGSPEVRQVTYRASVQGLLWVQPP